MWIDISNHVGIELICHLYSIGDFIEPMWFRGTKDGKNWFTIQAFNEHGYFLTSNYNADPTLEGIVLIYQHISSDALYSRRFVGWTDQAHSSGF